MERSIISLITEKVALAVALRSVRIIPALKRAGIVPDELSGQIGVEGGFGHQDGFELGI